VSHLRENNLLCLEQHGFTKDRSTVVNLLEALNIWSEALMHGVPVDVIYLDYAKAFDTVPYERLLRKVESLGIKRFALSWIRSFLIGRRQQVKVNKGAPVVMKDNGKWSASLLVECQGK